MESNLDIYREVFNKVDPIGIYSENATDEYDPEIQELLRLSPNFDDVIKLEFILRDIFTRYFEGVSVDHTRISSLAKDLNETFGGAGK